MIVYADWLNCLGAYIAPMVTFFECPECGVVRPSPKAIHAHCRNVKDHTTYDYDEMRRILDDNYERELAPARTTR